MKPFNPKLETLKLISLPLGLLILSYFGFLAVKSQYTQERESQAAQLENVRQPTSLLKSTVNINTPPDENKKLNLKTNSSNDFKKPHGALDVSIESLTPESVLAGKPVELVGTIKAIRDIDQVEIFWHLPSGVDRVDGEQTKTFFNLHAGDEQKISLKIISRAEVNQQIHLEASYMLGSLKVGNTSQFNTKNQIQINKSAIEQKRLILSRLKSGQSQHEETRVWQ